MTEKTQKSQVTANGIIHPPAYPWTARSLFGELRKRLARELREPMQFDRLGQIIGKSKATTYFWFDRYDHPQVIAFFCCLERLIPAERQAFVEAHCRISPSLEHPRLAHSPTKTGKLWELLHQRRGLTIITGNTDSCRNFVITALGHSFYRIKGKGQNVAGVDLHRPANFVPVEGCLYLDGAAGAEACRRRLVARWPKIVTSGANLLLLNGLWKFDEFREDILRCAARAHVLLASEGTPALAELRKRVLTPIHLVTLFDSKLFPGGIRVDCRRIKTRKSPEKQG